DERGVGSHGRASEAPPDTFDLRPPRHTSTLPDADPRRPGPPLTVDQPCSSIPSTCQTIPLRCLRVVTLSGIDLTGLRTDIECGITTGRRKCRGFCWQGHCFWRSLRWARSRALLGSGPCAPNGGTKRL